MLRQAAQRTRAAVGPRAPGWHAAAAVPTRDMGWWSDLRAKLQTEIEKDPELKKSLDELRSQTKDSEGFKKLREAEKTLGDSMKAFEEQAREQLRSAGSKATSASEKAAGQAADRVSSLRERMQQAQQELLEKMKESGAKDNLDEAWKRFRDSESKVKQAMDKAAEVARAAATSAASEDAERVAEAKRRADEQAAQRRENEEATQDPGTALVATEREESSWDRAKSKFEGSAFYQGFQRFRTAFETSDNPLIRGTRILTSRVGGVMEGVGDRLVPETEQAEALRVIMELDPAFRLDDFMHHVTRETIPHVLGAFLEGDQQYLRQAMTEHAFQEVFALIKSREVGGVRYQSKILDLKNVELQGVRLMDDTPMVLVSFVTQQTHLVTDMAGKVLDGAEDDIRSVYYLWAFSPSMPSDTPDEVEDEVTRSQAPTWKVAEMAIQGQHPTL